MSVAVMDKDTSFEIKGLLGALLLTLCSSAIGFLVAGHFPFGDHIFLSGDYYIQSMPLIRLFWEKVLHGESLAFSMNISMGQASNAVFSIMSPFPAGIWAAFIKDPDLAAFMIFLTKQLLASAAFFIFCTRALGIRSYAAAICAASYANCGYVINFYGHINLLDGLYFLPLITLFLFELVYKNRWKGLCIIYALLFCVNIYEGYMIGIITIVMYIILLFSAGKKKGDVVRNILMFCLAGGLAVCMSCFVALPTLGFALENIGEDSTGFYDTGVHVWDVLANLFIGQNYGMMAGVPMVYCGVQILVLVPVFMLDKKIEVRKKLLLILPLLFVLICIFSGAAYRFINAFDMPDGNLFRFSFVISFLLCAAAAYVLGNDGLSVKMNRIAIGGGLAAVIYIAVMLLQNAFPVKGGRESMDYTKLAVNVGILCIYLFLLFKRNEENNLKRIMLLWAAVIMIENWINIYMILSPENVSYERGRDYYELQIAQNAAAIDNIKNMESEDDGIYRVKVDNALSPNNAMLWGYNGIGLFSSFEKPKVRVFLEKIGYFSEGTGCIEDYGGTKLTQAVFGQKYTVHLTDPRIEPAEAYEVRPNELSLPLAYMVSDKIKGYSADSENPFVNQQNLIASMLGRDTGILCSIDAVPQITAVNVKHNNTSTANIWELDDPEKGWGTVLFSYDVEHDNVYMYVKPVNGGEAGKAPRVATNKDGGIPRRLADLYTKHIMEMSYGNTGTYDFGVIIDDPQYPRAEIEEVWAYYVDDEALFEAVSELNTGGIELKSDKNGRLYGHCKKGGGTVFTSIPYDTGWNVYIDNEKTETFDVCDGAFLAFEIPEGEHELCLEYRDIWAERGAMVTLFGIVIFIALCVVHKMAGSNHRVDNNT